jgi:hypothetical protein
MLGVKKTETKRQARINTGLFFREYKHRSRDTGIGGQIRGNKLEWDKI